MFAKRIFFERQMTSIELTTSQRAIWDWFSANSDPKIIYNQLADEDRKVFSDRIKYQENADAVVRSRTRYVDIFLRDQKGEQLPYTRDEILQAVLLKTQQMHAGTMQEPRNESDIRAYVFSVCLTAEEQSGFCEETYRKNVELSRRAVQRFAQLVVDWMIRLSVLKEQHRETKTKEIFNQRFTTLQETYK
jgi:hypothetical protein